MIIQKLAYKGSFKKVPITLYYCTKMEKLSPFNQIRMEMLISLIVKPMLVSDRQVSHCLMMVGNVLGQDWNTAGCLNDTIDWYKRYVSVTISADSIPVILAPLVHLPANYTQKSLYSKTPLRKLIEFPVKR